MKCSQIIADNGFSMCHMDKNVGFIFGAPMVTFGVLQDCTLELYNSKFISQIYKIPQDLGIISPCQQDICLTCTNSL
jgi:hypothetical protein